MKRVLFTIIAICIAFTASAQQGPKGHKGAGPKENIKIEDFVSDLSAQQKSKIDAITRRSTKVIENYRKQQKSVRDSIRSYMSTADDLSEILFPLYEREGALQSEISKEYYRTKVAIDKVLTSEQYKQLREKMASRRQNKKQDKPKTKPSSKK